MAMRNGQLPITSSHGLKASGCGRHESRDMPSGVISGWNIYFRIGFLHFTRTQLGRTDRLLAKWGIMLLVGLVDRPIQPGDRLVATELLQLFLHNQFTEYPAVAT